MESGIYIRVGTENLLLEEMTEEQRGEWLKRLDVDGLIGKFEELDVEDSYAKKLA